ncbi:MAG: Ulp1 family isopeptidase [Cyanobacteriota bacterium]|nr:Ulp1 family isopeptidase [Cyanobacteriota bacterium]
MKDEAEDKLRDIEGLDCWPREYPKDIPLQTDGFDCGIFALLYADYISRGETISFNTQSVSMQRVRERMVVQMVQCYVE